MNPAMSLGIMLGSVWNGVAGNRWSAFSDMWIYPIMPFAGAALSLLFFEFVYKKTQETLDEHDEKHHDDGVLDS